MLQTTRRKFFGLIGGLFGIAGLGVPLANDVEPSREHELYRQIKELAVEQQLAQNYDGDDVFSVINKVIKETSKNLEKMIKLQKVDG